MDVVTAGPWIGTVTRVDAAGHPYARVPGLAGESEYGPLLVLAPRVVVAAQGLTAPNGPVAGAASGSVVYAVGDRVLVTDVAGQPSVFVVLGRVA